MIEPTVGGLCRRRLSYPMSSQVTAKLQLNVQGALAEIVLDRPAVLNAIDAELAEQLGNALGWISASKQIRAVLIRGEGRAFCAGGDIAAFTDGRSHVEVALSTMLHFHPAILRLAVLPMPTVAHLHGVVAGAGIGLMLACDLAYAEPSTRFSMAYPKIGASVDAGGSWFLPRILGERKAKELALLSAVLDSQEAARIGLINAVHDGSDPLGVTRQLATSLSEGPTHALSSIKRLVSGDMEGPLSRHLDAERDAFSQVARSKDFAEGLSAIRQKRSPSFSGD